MKKFIVFSIIVLVAFVLRFWQLGSVPASPDWDEASLGYNAYSILKTGRDEYGTFLPLSIRSFGDYKPPLYTYLTVPSVALFGLSTWSTRFPSAVMGILAVVGTYFLVREIFRQSQFSTHYSLLTTFLLAISPWHIQFSRVAFEANIGLTLNIWAVTAFLVGLRSRIYIPLSAILFALGLYAYHSERIFLPLLVFLLIVIYRKQLFVARNTSYIIGACILGFVITLPLLNKTAIERLSGTSVINQQTKLLARTVIKLEEDMAAGDFIGSVLDNRRFVWATSIASGYLSHFSLKWLFLTGDYYRHHAPDMGLLYLWELPFLLYGIFIIWKKYKGPVRAMLIGWLLIAPVAAAPTTDLPHAVRTLVFLPVFQILVAVGIVSIGFKKNILSVIVLCFAVYNFAYYMNMYFTHQNVEFSKYWQYGYKEAVGYTEKNKSKYEKIVVSSSLDQAYIFFLFYTKYDPATYIGAGGTRPQDSSGIRINFDKYMFKTIDWSKERCEGKTLYLLSPKEITKGNMLEIKYLDGEPAIEFDDNPCSTL